MDGDPSHQDHWTQPLHYGEDYHAKSRPATRRNTQLTFYRVSVLVEVDSPHDLIATLREDANGRSHYDLSMEQGAEAGASESAGRVAEARSGPTDSLGNTNVDDAGRQGNDLPGDGKGRNESEARQAN